MIKCKKNNIVEVFNIVPVVQFGEVQYFSTTISIKELSNIYDRLTYDGNTQRGIINGKPAIDEKHVQSIYDSFMDGNSIRGHLTWNLRVGYDGEKYFSFNEQENSILIEDKQIITLPDSAHRHKALFQASDTNDSSILDSRFSLDIYILTEEDEKDFFSTINGKIKSPNRNRTLFLSNDLECKLLRNVIENSNLYNRVECVRNNATKDGMITKFSTLYDSLFGYDGCFKGKITVNNYNEYLEWFIAFYNELLKTRDEFNVNTSQEKMASKQEFMTLEEISWFGYAYLAKELKGERKWKHLLHEKMNKKVSVEGGEPVSFLSKSLPIWHATVIKPKYNYITKTQEVGTSVTNSNTTRNSIKKIFYITLF